METPPGKDPKWISDRATYAQPHQYATGYNYVIVNFGTALKAREGKLWLFCAQRSFLTSPVAGACRQHHMATGPLVPPLLGKVGRQTELVHVKVLEPQLQRR